ncbi:MAG: Ku protein [Gammaproteobacteria bacterium]
MPRAIWTGAISFGLVYIPVQLHSASHASSLDLDFLDQRDFSPVGYQRINKRTGKVVEWGDIVKGYQYEKGKYVALNEEDFRQANVKATQTIDIQQFTDQASIPPEYFETPYYLSPGKGGAKVYALLREALKKSKKAAVATLVMRGRQHLAMLHPHDDALMLNTLRFEEEIRSADELDLPGNSAGVTPKELAMAERLIDDMTGEWKPSQFKDTYSRDLLARVKEKVRNRETHKLTPTEKTREPRQSAQVIDLMEVLKRSLEQGKGPKHASAAAPATRRRATRARKRKTA